MGYDKKTCNTAALQLMKKQWDAVQRRKQKFEEIEDIVSGGLQAKVAKKDLRMKR